MDSRTAGQPHGPSLRSAQFAQRVALAPASWGRAQRSEAKVRVDVLSPLPLWMRRGAQGLADQGSRLSERSEFERGPAKPEHRRLPRRAAAGTQTVGSPFLWFLSFGDAKERDSHAGRLPASALSDGMPFDEHKPPRLSVKKYASNRQRRPESSRPEVLKITIKIIAAKT